MERGWRRVAIKKFPSLRSNFDHPAYRETELLVDLRAIFADASEFSNEEILGKILDFSRWCREQSGQRNDFARRVFGHMLIESVFDTPGDWELIVSLLTMAEIYSEEGWWQHVFTDQDWRRLQPLLAARIAVLTR